MAVTEPTTNVAVTEPTTNVAVTEPTTNVAVTEPTTNVAVTEPTTNVAVTEPTTNVTVTEPTTNVVVTEPKTNVVVTEPKTNVVVTEPKTNVTVVENRLTVDLSDVIINIPAEGNNGLAGSIYKNGKDYIFKLEGGKEEVISQDRFQDICQSTVIYVSNRREKKRIETSDGAMRVSFENGNAILSSFCPMNVINRPIISRLNLSIGIAIVDDVFSVIIPEGTLLPAEKTKHYRASPNSPTYISLDVFQGASPICAHNQLIAKAEVVGLRLQKRKLGEIYLRMKVDERNIVKLEYKQTKEEIFKPLGLSVKKELVIDEEDIEAIKRNAARTRENDEKLAKFRGVKEKVQELIDDYGNNPYHSPEVKKQLKKWVKDHAVRGREIPTEEHTNEWIKKKDDIKSLILQLK